MATYYGLLAPYGFQNLLALSQLTEKARFSFETIQGSRLWVLTSTEQDSSLSKKTAAVVLAYSSMQQELARPLSRLNTFGACIAGCLPAESGFDARSIADVLVNATLGWDVPRSDGFDSAAKGASNDLQYIEGSLIALKKGLTDAAALVEEGAKPKNSRNPDGTSNPSVVEILSNGFASITDLTSGPIRDSCMTLNTLLTAQLTPNELNSTVAELVVSDADEIVRIVAGLGRLSEDVDAMLIEVRLLQTHFSGMQVAYAAFLGAMAAIPSAVSRFNSLYGKPPAGAEEMRSKVVRGWAIVLSSVRALMAQIGAVATGGENPVSPPPPYVEKPDVTVLEPIRDTKDSDLFQTLFGPPPKTQAAFTKLASQARIARSAFTNLLSIPYIDVLKVNKDAEAEISVQDAIIRMKSQFDELSNQTIPVAGELRVLASMQRDLLPTVNAKDGLTLRAFMEINLGALMSSTAAAKTIVDETTKARDNFQNYLDIFQRAVVRMADEIAKFEADLKKNEADFDKLKAKHRIDTILLGVFLLGTIASLYMGNVKLAGSLALKSIHSIYKVVQNFKTANELRSVIASLKDVLASVKSAKEKMDRVIPELNLLVEATTAIADIWRELEDHLTALKDQETRWLDASYFNPKAIRPILAQWDEVSEATDAYINAISGAPALVSTKSVAEDEIIAPFVLLAQHSSMMATEEMAPPPYREVAFVSQATQVAMMSSASSDVLRFMSAPNVETTSLRKADLNGYVFQWRNYVGILSDSGYPDIAQECENIANRLEGTINGNITKAVQLLLSFARDEPSLPPLPADAKTWNRFCVEKRLRLEPGNQLSRICDADLRDLQRSAHACFNKTTSALGRLKIQADQCESELREVKRRYDEQARAQSAVRSGLGALFGVLAGPGGTMVSNELIDRLQGSLVDYQRELARMQRDQLMLKRVFEGVAASQSMMDDLTRHMSSVSAVWGVMSLQTNTAAALWTRLEAYPTAEATMAKRTWVALEEAFGEWN